MLQEIHMDTPNLTPTVSPASYDISVWVRSCLVLIVVGQHLDPFYREMLGAFTAGMAAGLYSTPFENRSPQSLTPPPYFSPFLGTRHGRHYTYQ